MYRVFIKTFKAKRKLYSLENYSQDVQDIISKDKDADYYQSIFLYTEEQKQLIEKNGSVAGIDDVVTDRIVFDFDSADDIEAAYNDTISLVQKLIEYTPENTIRTYFSGSKGFHVEVHLGTLITLDQFKKIVLPIGAEYKTFDTSIKDHARVFRYPLTKHNKTKAYKIPLIVDDLKEKSLEEIIAASTEGHTEMFKASEESFENSPYDFTKLIKETVKSVIIKPQSFVNETHWPDLSNKPSYMTTARYVLQQGFFDHGDRNEACHILCATYRNLGFSKDHAYNMLKATLRLRAQRLGDEDYDKAQLWKEVIEHVYGPYFKGGIYKETESPVILKTIQKYNLSFETSERETLDIKEVSDKFIKFANEYKQNRILMGIPEIDKKLLVTTGMMVGLLGAPSSGKTGAVLNVLESQSNSGINSLFISADMSHNLLYARLMQRYCSMDFKMILEAIENRPITLWPQELKASWDQVLENYKNVGFSFQSGPSVPDIARRIKEREDLTGQAVKVLAVDYLEKVRSDNSDPTQASGKNASALADLSRDKELATILLLQPQKSAGDPSDELVSMRKVKGASVIEQDCRVILTTWRPGFNPNVQGKNLDDVFSSFAIVKNNMGETGRMDLKFDGLTGRLSELNFNDKQHLKQVEEKAKLRKAQAYKESTGGILSKPDSIDTVYTKSEKSSFTHRAVPNDSKYTIKKKDGDMY